MEKREFTIKVAFFVLGLYIPWEVSLKFEKKYQTKKLKYRWGHYAEIEPAVRFLFVDWFFMLRHLRHARLAAATYLCAIIP